MNHLLVVGLVFDIQILSDPDVGPSFAGARDGLKFYHSWPEAIQKIPERAFPVFPFRRNLSTRYRICLDRVE
jgi:hypothetical protein